ncbi:allantoicase-like [Chrysoperla carnea]|uniref:allantoicase-like n=1 Tax=Chrysoperla carnea TaxID=189513 RepID=UPI001D07D2F0|nr:allantoicase-like [Chrysoperla carnea]
MAPLIMDTRKKNVSPPKFTELNELCSQRNGGKILFATDDWFAPAECMLSDDEPVFKVGLYTECGKWMDGWETRRKRIAGNDWCIIKLGVPGVIHGFDIDTCFFTGNYAPRFSIQAARFDDNEILPIPSRDEDMLGKACTTEDIEQMKCLQLDQWTELIPIKPLNAGIEETRHNYFEIDSNEVWTHLRLNIFPDGGIARLRVYGEARPSFESVVGKEIDLLSMKNGGVCKGYSNAHFGHPRNLIRPGKGVNMGDGWETARRLDRPPILECDDKGCLTLPGSEWALFRLGYMGTVNRLEVDTNHFKGNFPDSIKIEGAIMKSTREWNNRALAQTTWKTILPQTKLLPHHLHEFDKEDCQSQGPFTHVRISIAPDGGVSRVRIFGQVCGHLPL